MQGARACFTSWLSRYIQFLCSFVVSSTGLFETFPLGLRQRNGPARTPAVSLCAVLNVEMRGKVFWIEKISCCLGPRDYTLVALLVEEKAQPLLSDNVFRNELDTILFPPALKI